MLINDDDKKREEYAEIYQVAHMYYDLDIMQADIAASLFLSRSKVSRLLTQARELGIVEIKVHPFIDRLPSVENKLKEIFGLKDAVVISTQQDNMDEMQHALNTFAAQYVSGLIRKGAVLGISDNDAVKEILEHVTFPDDSPVNIVQLMGSSFSSLSMQDTTLILSRIATHYPNVKLHLITAPLYVNDLYLKEVLLQDPSIRSVLDKAMQCTVALTGVSGIDRDKMHHHSWHRQMSLHHIEELIDRKAVGSICAQYYDINGIKVSSEWNAKTISMNLNNFARIKTRICVGQGLDKVNALYGAVRGNLVNVLITDSNTAADMIRLFESKPKK